MNLPWEFQEGSQPILAIYLPDEREPTAFKTSSALFMNSACRTIAPSLYSSNDSISRSNAPLP